MAHSLINVPSDVIDHQEPFKAGKRPITSSLETLIEAFSIRQRQSLDVAAIEHKNTPENNVSLPIFTSGAPSMTKDEILNKRQATLGPNMALFFNDQPLHIVKGRGCELFDPEGYSYLDCINNVAHVGHCHPRVAAAVSRQMFTLNTNSRYLHEGLVTLSERLTATMPSDALSVLYPVVSGSEANDLAWRIACAVALNNSSATLRSDNADGANNNSDLHICCVDHGYHGHTSSVIDFSAYKFWGHGGQGKAVHVHVLPCPDVYRNKNLDGAAAARAAIAEAHASGGRIAAFFCESIISCGGQVILPEGWLESVYREMRQAGAVCIADEVQCGFGRIGCGFWAFETQNVVPDIVTCGKPMGNGFPCAAVITTPALASSFSKSGMEFFATYGGCTAATAAALSVLDVLHDEKLIENAADVGNYAMSCLQRLQAQYPQVIGDVRGMGLMIGIELVVDASTKEPAPATAARIKALAKDIDRVLLSTEGPYSNVIKIKPPMCFSRTDVNRMVAAIEKALQTITSYQGDEKEALVEKNRAAVSEVDARRERLGAPVA